MREVFLAASFLTLFVACAPSPSSTKTSKEGDIAGVDAKLAGRYAGEYCGDIPNADGTAKTRLVLNADGTFKLTELFSRAEAKPLSTTGYWTEETDHAEVISLTENNIEIYKKFKTEEKQLRQLTEEGEVIEGKMKDPYLLKKVK